VGLCGKTVKTRHFAFCLGPITGQAHYLSPVSGVLPQFQNDYQLQLLLLKGANPKKKLLF
jgi:hypothetical protein